MKKRVFYTEWAYAVAMAGLSLSVALMTRADFGVSMVVAPAYLLYLKVNPVLPFFTFGMAEYTLQAVLLLLTILTVKKYRPYFLFSFVTAVAYGFLLDGWMALTASLPADGFALRCLWYVLGILLGAASIAFFFETYIAPEVYELLVKEIAQKLGRPTHRVKTVYDCVSCAVAVLMSFAFFGLWRFEGVKLGTVICALVNGFLIGRCTALYERVFEFRDALPWRKYFT
ncbi:MAG: hypothetical protein IKE11_02900 [Clostridia bacterium]|nr:hypothetical protein [Clostridia bacterium]